MRSRLRGCASEGQRLAFVRPVPPRTPHALGFGYAIDGTLLKDLKQSIDDHDAPRFGTGRPSI